MACFDTFGTVPLVSQSGSVFQVQTEGENVWDQQQGDSSLGFSTFEVETGGEDYQRSWDGLSSFEVSTFSAIVAQGESVFCVSTEGDSPPVISFGSLSGTGTIIPTDRMEVGASFELLSASGTAYQDGYRLGGAVSFEALAGSGDIEVEASLAGLAAFAPLAGTGGIQEEAELAIAASFEPLAGGEAELGIGNKPPWASTPSVLPPAGGQEGGDLITQEFWVMNTNTFAASAVDGNPRGLAVVDDVLYSGDSEGLKEFSGTNTSWTMQTGELDFGASSHKHAALVYVTCKNSNPITLRVDRAMWGSVYSASYEIPGTGAEAQEHTLRLDYGYEASHWQFTFTGEGEFHLEGIKFVAHVLQSYR